MTSHRSSTGLVPRTARWSATHPWRAIVTWLVLVAAATSLTFVVPTQGTTAADYRLGESGRAQTWLDQGGLDGPRTESALITAAGAGAPDRVATEAAAGRLQAGWTGLDSVTAVAPLQWNEDRSVAILTAQLATDVDDAAPLEEVTEQIDDQLPDLQVAQAGDLSVSAAIDERVADDLASAEILSVPIILVLMLLAFGTLIAAGIPVLLAITCVAATMGLSAPLSYLVHAEPTVNSMIVLIGMAVGVDYSLFYLKRAGQERAAGRGAVDAVEVAARTSGHSIVVSGVAVIASLTGLYVVQGATFDSLATGAILVVAIAVVGSVTVLPALLGGLGQWVDRPRIPLLWRLNRRIGQGGISNRILGPVLRHPVPALVVSTVAVGLLIVPAFGMRLHTSDLSTLPDSIPPVQTLNRMAEEFPSEGTTASVVVRAPSVERSRVGEALGQLRASALADPDFIASAADPLSVSADSRTSVLTLAIDYPPSDERVDDVIRTLREQLAPAALSDLRVEYAVGGGAAESLDFVDQQRERLPLVVGLVLSLTLLMMATAFRSLPVALISTALNLMSVGVAFGILTLVFRHGWGADLIGFSTPGFVIDWIPLFVLVVLVGLSMDYHVFVVSRVRELVALGLPTHLAVRRGIADTAGVVTSAAAVMVAVFSVFATLSIMEMQMLGVGLAAAILIDATVIRLVMLPAAIVLLGERTWWPRHPGRPAGHRVELPRAVGERTYRRLTSA